MKISFYLFTFVSDPNSRFMKNTFQILYFSLLYILNNGFFLYHGHILKYIEIAKPTQRRKGAPHKIGISRDLGGLLT